jgi:peptidyl-prolyl cis-trans isomerase SurA
VRSKFLTFSAVLFAAFALVTLAPSAAVAQEGEAQVVDEVIAQVNDDVITLSMLKRETRERVESLKVQNGMTEQQAVAEVAKRQADLIATLINEKLLLQKGKELDLASDVEAEVNRRLLEIAREQGINSIEKLREYMLQSKLDPDAIKQTMRTEMMKQAVLQNEVDRRVFLGFSPDEVKKYFDSHQDKFRKPESVSLSEIWLSSENKDDAAVKARALELVAQIRAGADFKQVASANSEREKDGVRTAQKDGGVAGTFELPSLRDDLVAALKDIKIGGVSEPIKAEAGYQILKIDARTPAGTTAVFNENQVREAMTIERQPKERETYLQTLRDEAFIRISDSYSDSVMPLLKLKTPTAAKSTDKKDNKKKDKKP